LTLKLSKGSLLLLHLASIGHVWRGPDRRWVASTLHTSRVVDARINHLIGRGALRATFEQNFLEVTEAGMQYLRDHPLEDALNLRVIR
jgi:hypothetical protein